MPEQVSPVFILLGGGFLALALWALPVLIVRWDTNRRKLGERERKAWLVLSILLPLLGFALYLAMRILRGYLSPPAPEMSDADDARLTAVKPQDLPGPNHPPVWKESPNVPEPAWGQPGPGQSNGKQAQYFQAIPATTVAVAPRPLRIGYTLVVLKGPQQGQQFILDHLPARIGRGSDVSIPLDSDLNVSRSHAEIYEWNGRLRIRDLQSSHGTQINEHAAADQAISPGDLITVGKTVLLVREIE